MIHLKVKKILDEQGKTPYWLSKVTGISPNNIGKICNGETANIRFDTMEKICKALNCTPNDIMEFDDPQLQRLLTYTYKIRELKDEE